jgi:8-oxo-dGTP pyrophosphatase MutT (NUDIX family)
MVKYDENQVHYVCVTGIIVKEGKYLITKRADWEKAFAGRWTVPGGKLKVLEYALRKKDTEYHWYNIFEDVLRREIEEEVGLKIKNIGYVTSMVYIRDDKIPCIVVSLFAEPLEKNPPIRLCNALTEFAWVDLEEAKKYDLIEGIYDELVILDGFLKNGNSMQWQKTKEH